MQQSQMPERLYALYGRYIDGANVDANRGAPMYLIGLSQNSSGGTRARLLILGKDGKYKHLWQPLKRIGFDFKQVAVTNCNPAYPNLRFYLGKHGKPCNRQRSVEVAAALQKVLADEIGKLPQQDLREISSLTVA